MGRCIRAQELVVFPGKFITPFRKSTFDEILEATRLMDCISVMLVFVLYLVNCANVCAPTRIIFTGCKMEQFTFVGS